MRITNEDLTRIIKEELESVISEKKAKKDACYSKVKSRYKVWPSAYASGALVKCRKVGAKNWGNSKKEGLDEEFKPHDMYDPKTGEKFAADTEQDHIDMTKKGYAHDDPKKVEEKKQASSEKNLGDWFDRKGEKGSKGGWVDCNAPDGKGGYKECAQGKRKKKPYCRPTPSACKDEPKKKS